jgi:lipoprotein-releasing system permease protein
MVAWFIARRYLASRFITFAAFLLVSLSVSMLIILLAVMEGFKSEMMDRIRGTSSDLRIESSRFASIEDYLRVQEIAERQRGVRGSVPFVETLVVYRMLLPEIFGVDRNGHLQLQVLDLAAEAAHGKLDEYLSNCARDPEGGAPHAGKLPATVREALDPKRLELRMPWGRLEDEGESGPIYPVLAGVEALPFGPGLELELTTISPVTQQPRTVRCKITGLFKSRDVMQDSQTLLMDLPHGIEFLDLVHPQTGATNVTGLRVFLEEGADAGAVKAAILEEVAKAGIPFVRVRTWMEVKERILRAVRMEKRLVGFILGVIVIFVGLIIFIILTVQIVEKTRDLGVLQAVGMRPAGIVGIYLRMGSVVCATGIALGSLYGVGFCYFLDTIQRWIYLLTGFRLFDPNIYYIEKIPVRLALSDFLSIIVPTVIFGFVASLMAALRAVRKRPLEAMRYE